MIVDTAVICIGRQGYLGCYIYWSKKILKTIDSTKKARKANKGYRFFISLKIYSFQRTEKKMVACENVFFYFKYPFKISLFKGKCLMSTFLLSIISLNLGSLFHSFLIESE